MSQDSDPSGITPSVTPVANRPRSPPPPTPTPAKFLGKGSFGCAVKPALPNINSKGDWIQYPDNITKIFFKKNEGLNAIQSQTKAKEILKNDNLRINKYKYNIYTPFYLPEETQKECFGDNISKYPAHIFPVRLPDLGVSMAYYDTAMIKKIQKINVFTILEQMNKLIQQVSDLYTQGYIHGDIREPNVMINPDTGNMTIIDFDWLREKNVFFKDYYHALGFYNNPPESLMVEALPYFYNSSDDYPLLIQVIQTTVGLDLQNKKSKILKYTQTHNSILKYRDEAYKNAKLNSMSMIEIFTDETQMIRGVCGEKIPGKAIGKPQINTLYQCYFDKLAETFDSYGLGFTLLEFVAQIYGRIMFYPYSSETKTVAAEHFRDVRLMDGDRKYTLEEAKNIYMSLGKFINFVLIPMASDIPSKRITANEAAQRSQKLINEFRESLPNASKELSRLELLSQYEIPFFGKLFGGKKTRKNRRGPSKRQINTRKH
jgi:serine/threonine protein kinase